MGEICGWDDEVFYHIVSEDRETGKELKDMNQESPMPIVASITVGMFEENTYLYACPQTREAVIIDPGDEPKRILAKIEELRLIPKYILNTHGHIDHIGAIDAVSAVYPVPLAIHPSDEYLYTNERMARNYGRRPPLVKRKADILLKEGDTISFGTLTLEVLYTPGHTQGGVCFVSRPYCVFSGDTLFHRSIGRTDLEGGNYEQILASIREKLYTLDDDLVVFPGHGDPTTILEEKHENPFVTIEEQ
jgi:glyoxylase-like metal-dependent hydrolase (beta-lactamase superfamily II)